MDNKLQYQAIGGFLWTLLQRLGNQVISFVLSIILARLLMPSDYGVIAIVLVFINLCDVFANFGMGIALVQKKSINETDLSTIFWTSILSGIILYALLFLAAPMIADFYKMPILYSVIRVLGIRIPIAAYNSVQQSIISRNLLFRINFYAYIASALPSAAFGIILAYKGYGVWALVWQQLSNAALSSIIIALFTRWYPKIIFSVESFRVLFSFGWKVLITKLVDTLYEDFRSLYIGKLYSATELAYYTRGKQMPHLVIDNISSSIATVMLPLLSKKQDNREMLKTLVRNSITTSSFFVMPLMFGLAAIARPLVVILLTEKWLSSVPFLQILCFNCALLPLQNANIQSIYAVGRSDIVLKLNIIKKIFGFISILICGTISVKAMAWGGVLVGIFALLVNSYPNKVLINYAYWEQIKDILPYIGISILMSIIIYCIKFIPIQSSWTLLAVQTISGIISYFILAVLFKVPALNHSLSIFWRFFGK